MPAIYKTSSPDRWCIIPKIHPSGKYGEWLGWFSHYVELVDLDGTYSKPWNEIIEWADKNAVKVTYHGGKVYFKSEEDAVLFLLWAPHSENTR